MSCIPCPGRCRDKRRRRTTSFAPSYLKTLPFPMRARNSLFCGIFRAAAARSLDLPHGNIRERKSTLFRLILGLYHPQQGRVYLETERGELPCSAAVRGLFGYVPQTPWLFSGSIRENLLLAKPEADDAALWEVLERAQCGFVRDLPDRLETVLSEEGGGLSAGQRQRLAIARAMLSAPRFLLLDEITSALDEDTEARLLTELTGAYPAAVFATHHSALPGKLHSETLHLEGIA